MNGVFACNSLEFCLLFDTSAGDLSGCSVAKDPFVSLGPEFLEELHVLPEGFMREWPLKRGFIEHEKLLFWELHCFLKELLNFFFAPRQL